MGRLLNRLRLKASLNPIDNDRDRNLARSSSTQLLPLQPRRSNSGQVRADLSPVRSSLALSQDRSSTILNNHSIGLPPLLALTDHSAYLSNLNLTA